MLLVLVMLVTSSDSYTIAAFASDIGETGQTETSVVSVPEETTGNESQEPSPEQTESTEQTETESQEPSPEQTESTEQTETESQEPDSSGEGGGQTVPASQPETTESQAETNEPETTEPESLPAANNGIMTFDAGNSEGASVDASAELIINNNDPSVESGENFQYRISYNVSPPGTGMGSNYTGASISLTLPEYVEPVTNEDTGKYVISGVEYKDYDYYPLSRTLIINLNTPLRLSNTNTITVSLTTKNQQTPNDAELKFDHVSMSVDYMDSNNQTQRSTVTVPEVSTRVTASAEWQIEKTITSGSGQDIKYVRDDDEFTVTYQVNVSDGSGVDNLGRLGFADYSVTDTLPTGLPTGGEAVEITDIKIKHGTQDVSLTEGDDYTIQKDGDGHPVSITFTTYDTIREGEGANYLEAGDATNTTYEYTVRYPYDPYTTDVTEDTIKVYTLTNTADLDYTLVGNVDGSDSDTESFEIGAYEDGVASADIKVKKSIAIGDETHVLDSAWAALYPDVRFTLYNEDRQTIARNINRVEMKDIALAADGIATFSDIKTGTYYIKETGTLAGFTAQAEWIKVVINDQEQVSFGEDNATYDGNTFEFTNTADDVGVLIFTKKGVDGNGTTVNLEGATFTLTSETGATYKATSASDGQVRFDNIPEGKYTLTETGLSDALQSAGYVLSTTSYDVTVTGNTINKPELEGNNTITNRSTLGRLTITKLSSYTDDDTPEQAALSDAQFQLYGPYEDETAAQAAVNNPTGDPAATLTTGSDGQATSGFVTQGWYVLKETKAPANYTAGASQVVQITAGTTATVTVENDPQAYFSFVKQGMETMQSQAVDLAGAVFQLYTQDEVALYGVKDDDGNFSDVSTAAGDGREAVIVTTYLDATGKSTSPTVRLSPGTYKYKETAPDPYGSSQALQEFTVGNIKNGSSWNLYQSVPVVNTLEYGQIQIIKSTADGNDTAAALNGAVFEVYNSREAAKSRDKNGLVDTITTGTHVINGSTMDGVGFSDAQLALNTTYYVREVSAPGGYAVNSTINEADLASGNRLVSIDFENEPTVSIEITKTDSVTDAPLAGAEFELYEAVDDGEGGTEPGSTPIATATTGDDGKLTFSNLAPNTTYYYKEKTAPSGYVPDTEYHEVKTKAYTAGATSENLKTAVPVKNDRYARLTVTKVTSFDQTDSETAPFSGVTFTLYKAADEDADNFDPDNDKLVDDSEVTTGADGTATWTNLEPGTYWLRETLPEGYTEVGGETTQYKYTKVVLTAGAGQSGYDDTGTATITNAATHGKIQIGKYSAAADGSADTNAPMSGVEFSVYSSQIDAENGTSAVATLTTGTNGSAVSGWLAPGTYYLKETKTLTGYVLDDTIYTVTVTANQTVTTATSNGGNVDLTKLVNVKTGQFTINKYSVFLESDGTNEEVLERLSGAEFTLYEYTGADDALDAGDVMPIFSSTGATSVKTVSMTSYTATVDGLEPGVYWLVETKVPGATNEYAKADDMLVRVLPTGAVQIGTKGTDGNLTWRAANASSSVDVKDKALKARIRVIKKVYGEDTRIDGAQFELYVADTNGTVDAVINGQTVKVSPVLDGNDKIVVIESGQARDEDGEKVKGETVTPSLEPNKTYYLKEIEVDNPNFNNDYYFDPDNCWTEVVVGTGGYEYSVTIDNYEKAKYPGTKVDEEGSPLAGAVVVVLNDEAKAKALVAELQKTTNGLTTADIFGTDGNLTEKATGWGILQYSVSNENGRFEFDNLVPGETYYIMEVVAPANYNLDRDNNGNPQYHTVIAATGGGFTSVDGNTDNPTLRIVDYLYHQIEIKKISTLSGQEYLVEGAEFTIYASNADDTAPDLTQESIYTITGMTNGTYVSILLPAGVYWIAETKVPDGFKEADRSKTDDDNLLKLEGNDYKVIDGVRYYKVILARDEDNTWFVTNPIVNESARGRFALTKVDSTSSTTKVSATFAISKYDTTAGEFVALMQDNNPVTISTTTTDAYTLSEFLEPGIYRLDETGVQNGYTMSTDPIYIQIEANKITDGSNKGTIQLKDEKVSGYLPATGDAAVTDGQLSSPISVTNAPKGKFKITKTGTWLKESTPLAGVTFDVYYKLTENFDADKENDKNANGPVTTLTTGSDGTVVSGLLDAGEYWVIETGVAEGDEAEYGQDSYTAQAVTVEAGVTANSQNLPELTVTNASKYGKFQITKEDEYSKEKLSGVTFEIYKGNSTSDKAEDVCNDPDNLVTDATMTETGTETGTYLSSRLPAGVYFIKEVKTADGYSLNEGACFGPFEVKAGELTDVSAPVTNLKDNSLTIYKYRQVGDTAPSAPTDADLITDSSVTFALFTSEADAQAATLESAGSENPEVSKVFTNANGVKFLASTGTTGKIKWTGLPNDTYYLKELSTPNGYFTNNTVYEIKIDNTTEPHTYEYRQNVFNIAVGGFELDKVITWSASDGGTTTTPAAIAGAGIQFDLYKDSVSTGNYVATLTTDDNGHISYNVEAGNYVLVENTADGNYTMDSNQDKGDETSGNYIDANGHIHIRVATSVINDYFTADENHAIVNIANKGRFNLKKLTKDGNADVALDGAVYAFDKLKDSEDPENPDSWTEDSWENQGTITINDAANGYTSGLLDEGTYRLIEQSAPPSRDNGNGQTVEFTVDPTPIVFDIKAGVTINRTHYDGIKRSLEVTKRTDTINGSQLLAGVTFELWTCNDPDATAGEITLDAAKGYKETQVHVNATNESSDLDQTTTATGIVTWQNLEPGKYVLIETEAPDGYARTARIVDVTECEDHDYTDVVQKLEVTNTSDMGRILIQKKDTNGHVITMDDTAEFKIYAAGDTEFKNALETVTVSGTYGESKLLPVGDYWVVETKAPDGYSLDDRLEGNLLVKKVTVTGNQNPTADFTGVFPNKEEGYKDLVVFTNHSVDIQSFKPSLDKGVRLAGDTTGYLAEAASDDSLMYTDVTADFLISGLTDGKNELPAEKFVVTDDSIAYQALAQGSTDTYTTVETPQSSQDYVMNSITLGKSVNKDGSVVLADVAVRINSVENDWETVETGIDLTKLADGETVSVDLPDNAVGFRVSYFNAGAGFSAGNITVNVTFKQRPSDASKHEIRKIINTVQLDWEDTRVDNEGKPLHQSGTETASAAFTLGQYDEELPYVSLTNEITNIPADNFFYSGGEIQFRTTAEVTGKDGVEFRQPIMSIELPIYTTLDSYGYTTENCVGGIRATITTDSGTNVTSFTLSDPIEMKDDNGNSYWKYVLIFDEDVVLEPGNTVTLEYIANIDMNVPSEVIEIDSQAYITSGYQLPLTVENPSGTSYLWDPGDASGFVKDPNSDNAAKNEGNVDIKGDSGLEYLSRPVSANLTRSNSLQVSKSIAVDKGQWLNASEVPTVKPGDTIYYQLTVTNNGGNPAKEIRFIDIVPFNGDTHEIRSNSNDGVVNSRSTVLPEDTDEHEYEPVEVLWVNGNPNNENVNATVYYCIGKSWDAASRLQSTAASDIPMILTKGSEETVWAGWTTQAPEDMSTVTAIGVNITYKDGAQLDTGASYSVTLAMRAPGYTAEEMYEYENAVIGNTTAVSVLRTTDTADTPVTTSDYVGSNEVRAKVYITTGSIGDYAFYDNNDNGIQDDGDLPARNVPVTLYRRKSTTSETGEWEVYKTTTTDQTTGQYLFDELPCNYRTQESYEEGSGYEDDPTNPKYYIGQAYYEYRVEFGIPDGYGATIRYAGAEDADSNIDADGNTDPITLSLTVDENGQLEGENNMTIDAGFVRLVNLGDYVWIDSNKNGIQDESESGINGVTVNLYKLDSQDDTIDGKTPYATQETATNDSTGKSGYYCFRDLPKGYYVVEFDISDVEKTGYTENYSFTTAESGSAGADSNAKYMRDENSKIMYTDVIHLTQDDMTIDAGLTVYSALGGFIFDDQDYDDTQSVYIPLAGTKVELYTVDTNGTRSAAPIASTVVGEDGNYLFDRLEAGRYQIHFQYPEEYMAVTAGVGDSEHDSETRYFDDETMNGGFSDIIELPADTADLTHDAGAYLLSNIGDYVWVDSNKNGIQDDGELPVQGIIVTLQQKKGDGEWETISTSVTDENGLYKFTGVKSSDIYEVTYRVVFDISRLITLTQPKQGDDTAVDSNALYEYILGLGYITDPVKPGYGEDDMTIDAGIIYNDEPCTVGDYVWYDKNQDGIQDADETGVEGITVILQRCESGDVWDEEAWETVSTTITDSEGKYLFSGLPAGYYRVGFEIGDPWTVTLTNIGDTQTDSNATIQGETYYFSTSFYMNPGQTDLTWDAGIYRIDEQKRPTVVQTVINRVITGGRNFISGVRTGDPTSVGTLFAAMIVSLGVIIYFVTRKHRKKSSEG